MIRPSRDGQTTSQAEDHVYESLAVAASPAYLWRNR